MYPSVQQRIDRLNNAFARVSTVAPDDPIYPYLTQYLCLRVAGLIERAVALIYYEYARTRGWPRFARFVDRRLERTSNLNAERLCQLAGQLDEQWDLDLRAFITDERKAAINSIVCKRHQIAHGETIGVGFVQLRDWYTRVLEIIQFVYSQTV